MSGGQPTSPRQREAMLQAELARGRYRSWAEFRRAVEAQAKPTLVDDGWEARRAGKPSFLMLCHDQQIDRRIRQQADSLVEAGWVGMIVAVSPDDQDHLDPGEPISIHRIGMARIVPDCPVYWSYQRRQYLACKAGPLGRILTDANWAFYRLHMKWHYGQQRLIDHPLPYDLAFAAAGKHYPADVIIAHDLTALPAGARLAEAFARQTKTPLVYDAHELYEEQAAFSPAQRKMLRQVELELLPQCDLVFTVNESIADEMRCRYGRRPLVLPNAIDPPAEFDPAAGHDTLRRHFRIHPQTPVLIYQGGLLPGRNIEALIEAAALTRPRDLALAILGNGPIQGEIERQIEQLGLRGRVFLKTDVDWSEILTWTASADVGVIPYIAVDLNSRYCTPNKLYEYIQAGVPILANDLPELGRHVDETGFGLTAIMDDAPGIARAMAEMLDNPSRLREMRNSLLARRHEFSWKHVSGEYVQRLARLIPPPA